MDLNELEVTNRNLAEDYSNFRLFGIGKETEAQKARRAKIKKALEDANKNIKQTTQDIVKNKELKKVLKANFLTYNPAVAIPRSSALLAFRVNLFGVSSRLYPAFLNEPELKKYNFNLENAKNAKVAWEKIANFWEDKIGGDRNKLKEAISGAWNKPVFRTKKAKARKSSTSTFDGDNQQYSNVADPYSGVAVGAYISAGLSIVGGIVKIIASNGAKKNPYNEGTSEYNDFQNQMSGETDPSVNQSELNKIIQGAIDDKKKGLGLDNTGIDAKDLDDKIMGIPKTGFYVGLTVLVLVGAFVTYKLVTRNKK